jgi:flagellar motility protein MotE (MotC chaperone)
MARKLARRKKVDEDHDTLTVTEDVGSGQQKYCPYNCPFEDTMLRHEDLRKWSYRLEQSIDKFSTAVTQALSVQAAHSARLTSMEKAQEENRQDHKQINDRIDEVEASISKKLTEQTEHLEKAIDKMVVTADQTHNKIKERITALETWRWLIVGGSLVVGGVLSFVVAKIALDWIAKYL